MMDRRCHHDPTIGMTTGGACSASSAMPLPSGCHQHPVSVDTPLPRPGVRPPSPSLVSWVYWERIYISSLWTGEDAWQLG